jgi:hypothetical protein
MAKTLPCPKCARWFGGAEALAAHTQATHDNPAWVPGENVRMRFVPPVCPSCGKLATITGTRFGPRAACCGLHSWGFRPLVDPDTHKARNAAHTAFDPLWQSQAFSRGEAYRRLQVAMQMTSEECHIAQMTAAQARRVVEIVQGGMLMEAA